MRTTVDDVHHRNGQSLCVGTTDVAIQGQTEVISSCASNSQRYTEDSICAEVALGLGAVELDHSLVDTNLVGNVHTYDLLCDDLVYVLNSLLNALTEVTALVAVTKLQSLVLTGRCAAGNCCTAKCAASGCYFNFDGRIAARVKDLTCVNTNDLHSLKSF